ncbi:C2H2-type zinc finger protein [Sporobolomyces koalae]|uniref:C2H2-type zinc finger protein n=1 Tax=Sporobolomyces koalae TaxID=500713 RepID=UPI0031800ECD
MASAVASTSAYVFPPRSRTPRPAPRTDHGQRSSLCSDSDSSNSAGESQDEYTLLPDRHERETDPEPDLASGKSRKRHLGLVCRFEGCGRSYRSAFRLAEHERSHTGERPHVCPECAATFVRGTHLKAHMRSHLPESDKNYPCTEPGCDKRFWTNQHLRKHIEVMHRGKTYDCTQCDEKFRKHHQLRAHIAAVHCTPGTKPFLCDYPGCERSFTQKVHLKAHLKTHDPSRYVCMHPDCAQLPLEARQFPVWSQLQKHTKIDHPPTCPHAVCRGKTFTTLKGLRAHLAIHEREAAKGTDGKDFSNPFERSAVKRQRSSRSKRERTTTEMDDEEVKVKMEEPDDEAELSVVREGRSDARAIHPLKGTDVAQDEESGSDWEERQETERDARMMQDFRFGGKKKRKVYEDSNGLVVPEPLRNSSVQTIDPLSTFLQLPAPFDDLPPRHRSSHPSNRVGEGAASSQFLDALTGANYSRPRRSGRQQQQEQSAALSSSPTKPVKELARKYPCPFPDILGLPFESVSKAPSRVPSPPCGSLTPRSSTSTRQSSPCQEPRGVSTADDHVNDDEGEDEDDQGICKYWFKRLYDVERHLRSRHGVKMIGAQATLKSWYAEQAKLEDELS